MPGRGSGGLAFGIALGALACSAGLGVAAMLASRRVQQLRDRLRAMLPATIDPVALAGPSIALSGPARHSALGWAMRAFGRPAGSPHGVSLPWVGLFAGLIALLVGWRLTTEIGALLAVPAGLLAGFAILRMVFGWERRKYRDAVFQQIPDALSIMVRSIRAGMPLGEALRGIGREMPTPTREEFARVAGDMAIGRPVEQALFRLHERTGLTEYAFLAVTLGLQSQTGGSLAETLENLADIVRKRVAMAKRAQALAAEARMQAGLLFVLPFIAAAGMSYLQPFYLDTFLRDPTGRRLAFGGFGLMILGLLTIRWLIRQAGQD
jgi:tight adherence protein B